MDKLRIFIIDYILIIKCKYFIYHLFKLIFTFSYKADYLAILPPINEAQALALERDENDLDIYIEEEEEIDELTRYFEERRVNKQVSNTLILLVHYIYYILTNFIDSTFNFLA